MLARGDRWYCAEVSATITALKSWILLIEIVRKVSFVLISCSKIAESSYCSYVLIHF